MRDALNGVRSSSFVKLTPSQLYDALAKFRTPGQSLLSSHDVRRLWQKCDRGDPETFLKLFRDHEEASEAGATLRHDRHFKWATPSLNGPRIPAAKTQRRMNPNDAGNYPHCSDAVKGAAASAEALRLRYKTSRTLVQPPVGWRKNELAKGVKRSYADPTKALTLRHCFGYTTDLAGPNLALAFHNDDHCIVYNSAACAIVQNIETGVQKVFKGHSDDIMCIATDRSGTMGATGQCAGTDCAPYVCVWSVKSCEELRRFGGDGSIARLVCAVCFFDDSSHIVAVGGDDRHTLRVYDLNAELGDTDAVIVAPCKAGVQPPAITAAVAAPQDTAMRFGNDHLVPLAW